MFVETFAFMFVETPNLGVSTEVNVLLFKTFLFFFKANLYTHLKIREAVSTGKPIMWLYVNNLRLHRRLFIFSHFYDCFVTPLTGFISELICIFKKLNRDKIM